jgi:predicted dehydrogenase
MNKIKWGIISTADIARLHIIPGMRNSAYCDVHAIASRNLDRAKAAAKELNIPKAYGSYEELLTDPEVQAVYNPLPNHLHVTWSIKAAEAGKHVLCEKPIALDAKEAKKLVAACERHHVLLMEAFMYRMHPQWVATRKMVDDGMIGKLKAIQVFFSYANFDPADIRNKADIGGGGLMDIGCYPISLSRFIFKTEPKRVLVLIFRDPEFRTDTLTSGVMDFESGHATFTCSTQLVPYQRVNILGTGGRIELPIPFNAPEQGATRIFFEKDRRVETIEFEACHQYQVQGDLFSKAILEGSSVPTPPEDAVANMKVIDAMFRSEKSGTWETV